MDGIRSCPAFRLLDDACRILLFFSYPKKTIVPNDSSRWERELKPAIAKLPDEDKRLAAAYLARAKVAEVFGAKSTLSDGLTIGKVIEKEKEWENTQAHQDVEAKVLQEKVTAEKEAVARQINETLTVALVDTRFVPSDWKAGNVEDRIEMQVAIENKGKRDIAGFKGTVVFADMFGDIIRQSNWSYDEDVPAGKSVTWTGGSRYNRFEEGDNKLRSIDMSKLKFSFVPNTVIFSDGTKIEATAGVGR